MIHAGTDIKWRVTVTMADFDIDEDNMELVIKDRWGAVKYEYKADDFFGGDGQWFFTMPNVETGMYYACLTCYRGDGDFAAGYQKVSDIQLLTRVGVCQCKKNSCDCDCGCHETDGMEVTYERVWTVNFIDGIYLADCYGRPILSEEGYPIRFSNQVPAAEDVNIPMTGEEYGESQQEENDNN